MAGGQQPGSLAGAAGASAGTAPPADAPHGHVHADGGGDAGGCGAVGGAPARGAADAPHGGSTPAPPGTSGGGNGSGGDGGARAAAPGAGATPPGGGAIAGGAPPLGGGSGGGASAATQPPPPPPPQQQGGGNGDGANGHAAHQPRADFDPGRRINLAETDGGATVIAANREAKWPDRAIDYSGDSYMKNVCGASKWLIIELSQLGRVDAIELTMKEMYSSRVKHFTVHGRQSRPQPTRTHATDPPDYTTGFASDSWQLLGDFTAENSKRDIVTENSARQT
ncbi:hypothetical protein FOA52_008957 [Chlamydomonas sp. UWO 241]|nr:hypothetical protein FOA52_008957 [Chlamydomonas sp. UWO 241]